MTQKDWLRPTTQPARMLYDAWRKESEKRDSRSYEEWVNGERQIMFKVANKAANLYNLTSVTMEQVELAEENAYGHVDYGAKWVYGILDYMRN